MKSEVVNSVPAEEYPMVSTSELDEIEREIESEKQAFGKRLREAVERIVGERRTYDEYGEFFGVAGPTAYNWFAGKKWPSIGRVVWMAKKLDVSVDWLLTGREESGAAQATADKWASLFSQLPPSVQHEVIAYLEFKQFQQLPAGQRKDVIDYIEFKSKQQKHDISES